MPPELHWLVDSPWRGTNHPSRWLDLFFQFNFAEIADHFVIGK